MLKREVNLLRSCDHPNIIKVYDLFEDEKKLYLVVEDLKGQNLFDYIIQNRQISESNTSTIAAQIISAIKYIHKQGFVCRFIKMDTIMFSDTNNYNDIRLCDFFMSIKFKKKHDEKPFLIEDIYRSPDSFFQGKKVFNPKHNHTMSAPELLPPENFLTDPKRYYDF
jgi:calcium-dependent protein kinase